MDDSQSDIQTLERAAYQGDVASALKLASQVYDMEVRESDLMIRVKNCLRSFPRGSWRIDWVLATFAVITDDLDAWNAAVKSLGSGVDPGLGYHAYQNLRAVTADTEVLERWFVAVELSARKGHFLAKRDVMDRRLKGWGAIGVPYKICYRFVMACHMLFVMLRDGTDARLPISARGLQYRPPAEKRK